MTEPQGCMACQEDQFPKEASRNSLDFNFWGKNWPLLASVVQICRVG